MKLSARALKKQITSHEPALQELLHNMAVARDKVTHLEDWRRERECAEPKTLWQRLRWLLRGH